MKVVFIGCKPFKGTDICGFQWSFYEKNLKVGDIFEVSELKSLYLQYEYNYKRIKI